MSRTISYRGQIAHIGEDTINLHTNDGKTGYKVVKFQLFPRNFNVDDEYNMQIWKVNGLQTSTPNFSDNRLLAAGYIETVGGAAEGTKQVVVFDNEIFNQDVYVTLGSESGNPCNYYIELEQVPLTEDQALVAIVKNLRNEQ